MTKPIMLIVIIIIAVIADIIRLLTFQFITTIIYYFNSAKSIVIFDF